MLIKDAVFNVFDVETTGLDPEKDRIVELGVAQCSIAGGVDVFGARSASSLFNPGIPIPASASATHHLVDEDVIHCLPFEFSEERMTCYCGDVSKFGFAAHNAAFDLGFMPQFQQPTICTKRLAQKLFPDIESYSNQFLRYHFKLPIPQHVRKMSMHRALPDALVTSFLLLHLLSEVLARAEKPDEADIERLVPWINEPMLLQKVKFGKHKGSDWCDVPKDYLGWILRSMNDLDVDTRYTAEHWINK